jgi:opacity protein-like surface antigen
MRKIALCVLMCALAAGALSAQGLEKSIGGGLSFEGSEGSVSIKDTDIQVSDLNAGFTVFVFADLTYVEVSLGFAYGGRTIEASGGPVSISKDVTGAGISFSILGKYPFHLGQKFTLFPLLGVQYDTVAATDDIVTVVPGAKGEADDFSTVLFKAGLGLDFALTQAIFLRLELLAGIGAPNQFQKDVSDALIIGNADAQMGYSARLAAGYKF